jgi:hypothetical protein
VFEICKNSQSSLNFFANKKNTKMEKEKKEREREKGGKVEIDREKG